MLSVFILLSISQSILPFSSFPFPLFVFLTHGHITGGLSCLTVTRVHSQAHTHKLPVSGGPVRTAVFTVERMQRVVGSYHRLPLFLLGASKPDSFCWLSVGWCENQRLQGERCVDSRQICPIFGSIWVFSLSLLLLLSHCGFHRASLCFLQSTYANFRVRSCHQHAALFKVGMHY